MCTRQDQGQAIEFGTSGYTKDDVFVLYDRTTESVWYPMEDQEFVAVSGARRGDRIPIMGEPAPVKLEEWMSMHSSSLVLLPSEDDIARLNRPYMGVQLGEREDGLFIDEVVGDSAAQAAGLQAGDRIVELDRTEITTRSSLSEVIREHAAGDTVVILVERADAVLTLELTFGKRE